MTKDKSLQTKTFIEALCQFKDGRRIDMKPEHYGKTQTHICTKNDIIMLGNYPNLIAISCNDTTTIISENATTKQLAAIMDILEPPEEEE